MGSAVAVFDVEGCEMRILVVGAGVIGSVYAARLLEAGHTVTVSAPGRRLGELRDGGWETVDPEGRPPDIFDGTSTIHTGPDTPTHVLLPIILGGA